MIYLYTTRKTLRTLEGCKKYTKNPRFERNWNKSRPYQKQEQNSLSCQKQIKSTSVWDGKIFITDKADNRKIITCEDELNAILNTGCVNQDGTFNINLSLPPPQSHGMFVVRPPSPALLSQQGIPLGLPQIPCQPHMLNQFIPNMFGSQLM